MTDDADPACWQHLTCEECGGVHEPGEPCQTRAGGLLRITTPERGSTGLASAQLNATLVTLDAHAELPTARVDRDVAITVTSGSGAIRLARDGAPLHDVHVEAGTVIVVPAGCERTIRAGDAGLTWSSIHVRRR